MLRSGELRRRLARTLRVAYGDGLLSEATLVHRLELLFGSRVVDPQRVAGDLTLRPPKTPLWRTVTSLFDSLRRGSETEPVRVLALDWAGEPEDLLVGRDPGCDIVLGDPTVSRRHVQLRFHDGIWSLRDLDSTNGTRLNDSPVVRCQLRPGDLLLLGDERLRVD